MQKFDLLTLTKRLCEINSVSGNEKFLADFIFEHLSEIKGLSLKRISNTIIAQNSNNSDPEIILAGHIDTVSPSGNEVPIIKDDVVFGLGACDMKGGISVMLALANVCSEFNVKTKFIFYESEEIELEKNGLRIIANLEPETLRADGAILLEPTKLQLELGCQGVVLFNLSIKGKKSHSARPWKGINAIYRASDFIEAVKNFPLREVALNTAVYKESLQAVKINGGSATNVVPDRVDLLLSYRYAPDLSKEGAVKKLTNYFKNFESLELGDEDTVLEARNGARPAKADGIFAKLFEMLNFKTVAKLGWTDVAFFSEQGTEAVNFGPGDPELAHGPDELVPKNELDKAYITLYEFFCSF
jgi:succinyl-diaminopimelate desuccinylase